MKLVQWHEVPLAAVRLTRSLWFEIIEDVDARDCAGDIYSRLCVRRSPNLAERFLDELWAAFDGAFLIRAG